MAEAEELPRSHVKRIVRAKLAHLASGKGRELAVQKEALHAMQESAKIFIHYLTATANALCHEAKRSTISAEDVLRGVVEAEFHDFLPPLQASLQAYKQQADEKKDAAQTKKRKAQEALGAEAEAAADSPAPTVEGASPSGAADDYEPLSPPEAGSPEAEEVPEGDAAASPAAAEAPAGAAAEPSAPASDSPPPAAPTPL